ncbi:hypothetical protein SUDANB145_06329 [Streptomyces sp. enrichment culture]|uniref:sensor histidine kinase n=1 Tax=Streptomyces sp. enrichment culture TaxID=1795815 RepID=UPI003F56AA3A
MLNEQRHGVWTGTGSSFGCAALLLLALADTGLSLLGDTLTPPVWSVETVMALAATVLWMNARQQPRRRLPWLVLTLALCSLGATVLVTALGAHGTWGWSEALALLLVLTAVTHRAAGRPTVLAIAALFLALCVQPSRSLDTGMLFGFLQGLAAAVAVVIGLHLRFQAAAHEQQLAAVRAEQRAEFARDLHDFVAHHVTGIVVQAQGARYVAGLDPDRTVDALGQIEQAGTRTLTAMRRMVGVLRHGNEEPPLAPPAGLGELAPLVEDFAAADDIRVRLSVDDIPDDLPVEVTSTAYRVVMEALTNVRKHADTASRVEVSIRRTPQQLLVRVANDGPPAPPRRSGTARFRTRPGFGLVGLAERVGTIGGRIEAGPRDDGGWVVDAALPVADISVRSEGGK